MAVLADAHLHSSYSGDSDTPMEEMIRRGMDLGLASMCFTEHMDMDYVYGEQEEEGLFELDTDADFAGFKRLREKYGDRIKLHFGVELGVQPGNCPRMPQNTILILLSRPPTFVTGKTLIIRIFLKGAARRRLTGNILLPFWTM